MSSLTLPRKEKSMGFPSCLERRGRGIQRLICKNCMLSIYLCRMAYAVWRMPIWAVSTISANPRVRWPLP